MTPNVQSAKLTATSGAEGQAGRYVYGIVRSAGEISLGPVGLKDSMVHTVVSDGLGALVHDCPPLPYQSSDTDEAATWVLAHHRVVEIAWKRWGTVLPLVFNTIIAADACSAQENLALWLRREHESLESKLQALEAKSEYGVQVFWDLATIAAAIVQSDPAISQMETMIQGCSRGAAYMYRESLEKLLKKAIESRAAQESEELYRSLSRCVDRIHIGKTIQGHEGRQMLLNLSCLVANAGLADLSAQLEKISVKDGYSARLAGPLPPYSFC